MTTEEGTKTAKHFLEVVAREMSLLDDDLGDVFYGEVYELEIDFDQPVVCFQIKTAIAYRILRQHLVEIEESSANFFRYTLGDKRRLRLIVYYSMQQPATV